MFFASSQPIDSPMKSTRQVAAKLGIEITSDDIARILDVTGTHGHQFPASEFPQNSK